MTQTLLERWDAVGAVLAEVRPDEIRQAIVDAERLRAELALAEGQRDVQVGVTAELVAERDRLRELLRFWSHEGRLQTFDDRERFRAMAAAVLKEKP